MLGTSERSELGANSPLQTRVRPRTIEEGMGGITQSTFEEVLQRLREVRGMLHVNVLHAFEALEC